MSNVLIGEFIGTMLLVLLGDGVCANVTLNNSGFKAAGPLFIALGWGLAVCLPAAAMGGIAENFPASYNPALTVALAADGSLLAGKFTIGTVIGMIIAEMAGGFVGAILVWIAFKPQFDASSDLGDSLRGIFCTAPGAPTSASGYIYPSLWLQEHYGKTIADLDHVVQSDSHSTSLARLATGQADVMVSYGHIRIKNAPIWQEKLGGTAPMVEQTGIIGVTEGIYNDMIAYSKNSDLMADEDFRKALGEAFIEIAQTDEGKEIISVFSQVGYTWGKDSDYDGERDAQAMLKSAGK